jgi:predicted GNAT family N-acyltransferase
LLTCAIDVTQRIGATAITLSARETATGFYEKFGFRAEGNASNGMVWAM